MIKSLYFRLFFLGLPSLYIAIQLSRFSLSMVNAVPYYFGMIMAAVSIFSGLLIGFLIRKPFREFFTKNHLAIYLAELIFLNAGHIFNWMDAGVNAKFEIIYYFAGLSSIGLCGSLYMQYEYEKERRLILFSILTGSVLAYFIGVRYFEPDILDMYLGIPVCIIALLNQIFINKKRSWQQFAIITLLMLINIIIILQIHLTDGKNFSSINHLGYIKLKINNNSINIIDNRNRTLKDTHILSLQNESELPIYQLQSNRSQINVLFAGYPGSLTPLMLYRSPFVKKVDVYFWDIPLPKNFPQQTIMQSLFYRNEWDFLKLFPQKTFDLIIIEDLPDESEMASRIFLHYAKRLLNQPNGVIAFPEKIARKYDGQLLKGSPSSTMVMMMGGESTEKTEILEKRLKSFLFELNPEFQSHLFSYSVPDKLITSFDESNTSASYNNTYFKTVLPQNIMKLLLYIVIAAYLVYRLFKCRYKNNQNGFFALEAGFTFSIILFCSLMLLSELRLVYPYFTPALFGIAILTMLPIKNKKFAFISQCAVMLILIYFTSMSFIKIIPPVYVVPVLLPLSFIAIANTLDTCKIKESISADDDKYILFAIGILLTLVLLLFAKNNNLYPILIYSAIASRLLYYLKI